MSDILESKANFGDSNGKRWDEYDKIICPNGETIDMVKLLDDQERAKSALYHLAPTLGGFLGKLRFVYTFRVKTQATDGFNILVNPQFTNSMDFTGKCFVMAHEVMHCLLNHMRRLKGKDHRKVNIAGDYEVNCTLCEVEANGQSRPLFKPDTVEKLGGLYDKKYIGMGIEAIYDALNNSNMSGMDNNSEASQAKKNQNQAQSKKPQKPQTPQQNKQQQQKDNQQQNSQPKNDKQQSGETKSEAYRAGWAKAIADWKAGKIKL